jgi:hypothetical protein
MSKTIHKSAIILILFCQGLVLHACSNGDGRRSSDGTPSSSPTTKQHDTKPAADAGSVIIEPKSVSEEKELLGKITTATYVLAPRTGFLSFTDEKWILTKLSPDSITFEREGGIRPVVMEFGGADRLPTGSYPMGNDQRLRIISVDADASSVTIEVEYTEGVLQDLAF